MSADDDLYGELDAEDMPAGDGLTADADDEEDRAHGRRNIDRLIQNGNENDDNAAESGQQPQPDGGQAPALPTDDVDKWTLGSNSRCFIVKPDCFAEIEASYQGGTLHPPPLIRNSIANACKTGKVVLVFCVNHSRAFQGYAEVDGEYLLQTDSPKIKLNWLRLCNLNHRDVNGIVNKYNGNHPVKISRDGQELEINAANSLIQHMRQSPEMTLEAMRDILKEVESIPGFNANGSYSAGDRADSSGPDLKRLRQDDFKPGEHPALFGLDLKNMTYEEYLEQYNLRKSLAFDKYHAQLAASAAATGGPAMPMGMGMGMGMGMMMPGMGGGMGGPPMGPGFFPGGGPGGPYGMPPGPGGFPAPHMHGGGQGYYGGPPMGGGRGRYGGGGRGRGGGRY